MASLSLLYLFLFLHLSLPSTGASERVLLRSLGDVGRGADAAVDLNSTNFDEVLKSSPTSYAIVEFFAHWCPACRNYKPQYEKVAKLFNGPDAAHPGIILMTRVDCAMKVNTNLCDRFSVGHYPMLLWGPPAKFANAKWDPKQEKSDIQLIDDGRTSQRLLNWINKRIGSSFNLDDEKYENENLLPRNASDPAQIARAIFDVEEATAKAFEIILEHKMIKPETRAPLIKFFQLLVAHHPSRKCRKGSADLLINFDEMWPSSHLSLHSEEATQLYGSGATESTAVCGKEAPRGYWIFCRGSKNDTRGFSCGLWVLMHSLSVRVGDGESQSAFVAIRDFIHNFFICEECRRHFYDMCLSVKTPFESTRALSLWLWQTHNKVNERLMKEEKNLGTGDPSFPKSIWPPCQLCPTCHLNPATSTEVQWNEDEVFKFLVKYYGQTLASPLTKEASTVQSQTDLLTTNDSAGGAVSAELVPVWAALGIALASVTFGALACFWRAQQKNRKQRKNWS
ncbi:sulfhydryl oxidase 2 isoform X2 [Carex littledalei]|uniref:Sulfhydryl oxidase n=1 Tax=Carex littledalei TaxID=544730 RepID=A0A833R836_9POAL|nr:sulfhydryl oxidase 2 isoform X2 [Carex littledalei]